MRFKKRDKVDDSNPDTSSNREMVSRKFMRPQPRLVEGVERYATGDVVEVSDKYSRKLGIYYFGYFGCPKWNKKNRKSRGMQFLDRIFGCSQDLVIDSSDMRMRRTSHGEQWSLMGKGSQSGGDVITSKPLTSNFFRETNFRSVRPKKKHAQGYTLPHEPPVGPTRSSRRMPDCGSLVFTAQDGPAQKLRAVEKESQKHQARVERSPCSPSNIIPHGITKRRKNRVLGFSSFKVSDSNAPYIDACSVGSCSISNGLKNSYSRVPSTNCRETDTLVSDAESFYEPGSTRKISHPYTSEEDLEVSVRELELQAYRRTMGALYASGPLSWEQEAMLTNLRIMLHISNDEHLKELKHLISTNMDDTSVR